MSKTKIVVIDENKELVKEIEEMYVNDPDFEVVAFANNGVDGIVKIEAFKPDVVIIDIRCMLVSRKAVHRHAAPCYLAVLQAYVVGHIAESQEAQQG